MAADAAAARLLVAARDDAQREPGRAARHAAEALLVTERTRDPAGQAWAHYWLAAARNNTAEYLEAFTHARRALSLFNRTAMGTGEALALWQAGVACAWLGRPAHALRYNTRALALVERHSMAARRPAICNSIGLAHYLMGDLEGAVAAYDRGLEGPFSPDEPTRASLLINRGIADLMLGNMRGAFKFQKAALDAAERARQPARMAEALTNLGGMLEESGDLAGSEAALRRAHALARECGARRPEIISLISLGDVALVRKSPASARKHYEEALALSQTARQPYGIAQARIGLGNLALRGGDARAAREALTAALAVVADSGDRQLEVVIRELLREVALALGDTAGAKLHKQAGLRLQRAMKARSQRRGLWLDKFKKLKK